MEAKIVWPYIAAAMVLATLTAKILYAIFQHTSQKYTQLIVGSISWEASTKTNDYVLLLSLVFSFFLYYFVLQSLNAIIVRKYDQQTAAAFKRLLVFALMPAAIWLGSLFLGHSASLDLVWLSALIFLLIIYLAFLTLKGTCFTDGEKLLQTINTYLLTFLFSLFAGMALAMALSRFPWSWNINLEKWTGILTCSFFLVTIIITGLSRAKLKKENFYAFAKYMLLAVQLFLPFLFLTVIPTPWIEQGVKYNGYQLTVFLPGLIAIFMLISWLDLYKRWQSKNKAAGILSPFSLLAILVFIKIPNIDVSMLNPDDYHGGEFLLPWWLWHNFNAIPFWDYVPARGLMNYVQGLFANFFFDGTAPTYVPANIVLAFCYITLGFWGLLRWLGYLTTFVAMAMMPLVNGMSEIDLVVTLVLCLLACSFLRYARSCWLFLVVVVGTMLFLYAPGQAALLLVALSPLIAVAAYQAVKYERTSLLGWAVIIFIMALLLACFTNWPKMMLGAMRYLTEQSAINSIAHGILWRDAMRQDNPWLWEIIRTSWLGIAFFTGIIIYKIIFSGQFYAKQKSLVFLVPVLLLSILYIFRAAGRIDGNWVTRLGIASVWMECLILPLLFKVTFAEKKQASLLLLAAFGMGLIAPSLGAPIVFKNFYYKPFQTAELKMPLTDAASLGFPDMGKAEIAPNYLGKMLTIKSTLQTLLNEGETYLDATNRNAQYFYLGYNVPIEVGAVYNLVSDGQQLRAVTNLKKTMTPVALVEANNILHDGGPLSLRTYLVYRFLVENYQPVSINGYVYMVQPERMARLLSAHNTSLTIEAGEPATLLNKVFNPQDLRHIPLAWGQSFDTLLAAQLSYVAEAFGGELQMSGQEALLDMNVEELQLQGQKAGLLGFDVKSKNKLTAQIYWQSELNGEFREEDSLKFSLDNGKLLVPLDVVPSYLLAKQLSRIRIKITGFAPNETCSLQNFKFYQRRNVGIADN